RGLVAPFLPTLGAGEQRADELVEPSRLTTSCGRPRAQQRLWYPEFLPDPNRPAGLPGSDNVDRPSFRPSGTSESFGTLRYGRLAEVLLYDVRPTVTLAGPTAVFVAPDVEAWLKARAAAREVIHLVQVPSNPPGWSAGKWGEWYP